MEEIAKFWDNVAGMVTDADKTVLMGTVTKVNETERTCVVKIGNVEYEDVRLYGVVKGDLKGFCFIPTPGSFVLTGRIDGSNELFVLMFTEIDKVLLTIGEKVTAELNAEELTYTNDKVKLKITGSVVELEADQITLNGGNFDGMVKVRELEKNLDSIKKFAEAIHAALPAAFSAVGAAMAATGANGATSYNGAMAGKAIQIGDIENTKVKH